MNGSPKKSIGKGFYFDPVESKRGTKSTREREEVITSSSRNINLTHDKIFLYVESILIYKFTKVKKVIL